MMMSGQCIHATKGRPQGGAALRFCMGVRVGDAHLFESKVGDARLYDRFDALADRVAEVSNGLEVDEFHPLMRLIRVGPNQWQTWPDWVEWYAGTDLEPPPGFTAWKGEDRPRGDRTRYGHGRHV